MRLSIPIRAKLIGLVGVTLSVSLASTIYVGSSLFVTDKTSYIYDYNATKLREAARAIDGQIDKAVVFGRLAAEGWKTPPAPNPDASPVPYISPSFNRLYEETKATAGMEALILLKPTPDGKLEPIQALGPLKDAALAAFSQLGWSLDLLRAKGRLVGSLIDGKLPVGTWAPDSEGSDLAVLTWLSPDLKLGDDSKQFDLRLVDVTGHELIFAPDPTKKPATEVKELAELEKNLMASKFEQGALDWNASDGAYLAGYQKLAGGALMLLGMIPKSIAFSAVNVLQKRYLYLGAGILLITLGLSFLLAQGLTRRLKQVWEATRRVSTGDFSSRVLIGNASRDEVTDLATSFNSMSEKIVVLMKETAEKARMAQELETAQAVQEMFFPTKPFTSAEASLAGRYLPASECAGDWWNYAVADRMLYSVIGDVTGHGVSSAFVTAAVNGAFNIISQQFNDRPDVVLPALLTALDVVVYGSARGGSTMTFLATALDLNTGELTIANASHCKPYLFRQNGAKREFVPIMSEPTPPLGSMRGAIAETIKVQLNPGDWVLGYTDGLLDCANEKEQRWSKMSMLRMFDQTITKAEAGGAPKVTDAYLSRFLEFLGAARENRIDDVTILVCGYRTQPAAQTAV